MDNFSPPAAFAELGYYSDHFMDPVLWEPFVRRVAAEQGFECLRILPGLPGTYPTFIFETSPLEGQPAIGSMVLKFFGPLFDGHRSFQVERAMGHLLASRPMILRSPSILAEGQLGAEWKYLVFEHIPGVNLSQVRSDMQAGDMLRVAEQIGLFMAELHRLSMTTSPKLDRVEVSISSEGFKTFLESQRASCLANHQRWQDLPPHLLAGLEQFVLPVNQLVDPSAEPHLVHADLTADHLLGRLVPPDAASPQAGEGWESLAIIDWGDCREGNILYELVALHLDLFQADKRLLRACLEAYRLPTFYQQDFANKALSMALLHQFPMPANILASHRAARSLNELAEHLFALP